MKDPATPPAVTPAQVRAAVQTVAALAVCIRDLGRVPSGHLYARVMGLVSLDTYQRAVAVLVRDGLVTDAGHELVWVGPPAK